MLALVLACSILLALCGLGDLEAVWDALPKAEDKAGAELGDLFDVEVRVTVCVGVCGRVWFDVCWALVGEGV